MESPLPQTRSSRGSSILKTVFPWILPLKAEILCEKRRPDPDPAASMIAVPRVIARRTVPQCAAAEHRRVDTKSKAPVFASMR